MKRLFAVAACLGIVAGAGCSSSTTTASGGPTDAPPPEPPTEAEGVVSGTTELVEDEEPRPAAVP